MDLIKKYNNRNFRNMYNFLDWVYYFDPNFKWYLNDKRELIIKSLKKEYLVDFTLTGDVEYKYKITIVELEG